MHSLRWFCPMTPDFSRRSAKTFSWKLVWRMVLRTLELLPRCHKWEFGRLLAVTDWVLGEEFASWDCFNKLWQKMLHHCRFFIFDFNFMNVSLFYWVDLPIPWIVCEISWIISESCVVGRIPHPSNLFKQDSPRKADMDQMCLTGPKKDIFSAALLFKPTLPSLCGEISRSFPCRPCLLPGQSWIAANGNPSKHKPWLIAVERRFKICVERSWRTQTASPKCLVKRLHSFLEESIQFSGKSLWFLLKSPKIRVLSGYFNGCSPPLL